MRIRGFALQSLLLLLTALALTDALAGAAERAKPAAPRKHRPAPADAGIAYGERADVMQLADEIALRQGWPAAWVRQVLAHARLQPAVVQAVTPPPEGTAKNWTAYRERFIEPTRVSAGARFWRANRKWLERAEQRYGVAPQIIVGIIGVETLYGRHTGRHRVLDALATLSFDHPPTRRDRSAFFRSELEEFLRLCRQLRIDPARPLGSYAGAMGLPQFMPSSWNRYAIDFDGDGRIDLQRSAADAIGSVAHYLAAFGWQRDLATHFAVEVPAEAEERATLLAPDIVPSFRPLEMAGRGARLPDQALAHEGPLALVELQNGDAEPSYVAGTANFYVVTRYNWSAYYAMAVIELGAEIARNDKLRRR